MPDNAPTLNWEGIPSPAGLAAGEAPWKDQQVHKATGAQRGELRSQKTREQRFLLLLPRARFAQTL